MAMSPDKIWELFCKEFPSASQNVTQWFGRNKKDDFENGSIRIMMKTGKTLIFGVHRDGSWALTQ